VTYSVGQGVSSRYVCTARRHAGLISWAHGHGRSMSVALRPASVMARASLQQPAQAQTDPHKKMNTDNINNAGGLCSPSWIPLHAWRSGKFLSTDQRLTKQEFGPILTPLLTLCTCYDGWRRYTKYMWLFLCKWFYFGACLDVFMAQNGVHPKCIFIFVCSSLTNKCTFVNLKNTLTFTLKYKWNIALFYVYGFVHHNTLYEITNRCSYVQSILFQC